MLNKLFGKSKTVNLLPEETVWTLGEVIRFIENYVPPKEKIIFYVSQNSFDSLKADDEALRYKKNQNKKFIEKYTINGLVLIKPSKTLFYMQMRIK